MRLVVDGLANREIAKELGLSEHTIKNYVFRIFDKVGISNRVELVHYALAHRDLRSEDPSGLVPQAMTGPPSERAASDQDATGRAVPAPWR